jgi:hypothetical protein
VDAFASIEKSRYRSRTSQQEHPRRSSDYRRTPPSFARDDQSLEGGWPPILLAAWWKQIRLAGEDSKLQKFLADQAAMRSTVCMR